MNVEPIVEWIGSVVIRHGERDDSEMCLCGHDNYLTCPGWLFEPGIGDLIFTRRDMQP